MIEYNSKLIVGLEIFELIDKYNFNYENYNKAIFYALSALGVHFSKNRNNKISTNELLLGDYYSFEYYDLLKDKKDELKLLTEVMSSSYVKLLKDNNIEILMEEIVNLLFVFYGEKFSIKERENFQDKVKVYYKIN